jgi:hypothetical protein
VQLCTSSSLQGWRRSRKFLDLFSFLPTTIEATREIPCPAPRLPAARGWNK